MNTVSGLLASFCSAFSGTIFSTASGTAPVLTTAASGVSAACLGLVDLFSAGEGGGLLVRDSLEP